MDPTTRSKRISNKILITTADNTPAIKNPKTYRDAIETPEGPHWKEAMDYELSKLKEMNTWSAIDKRTYITKPKYCQECGCIL